MLTFTQKEIQNICVNGAKPPDQEKPEVSKLLSDLIEVDIDKLLTLIDKNIKPGFPFHPDKNPYNLCIEHLIVCNKSNEITRPNTDPFRELLKGEKSKLNLDLKLLRGTVEDVRKEMIEEKYNKRMNERQKDIAIRNLKDIETRALENCNSFESYLKLIAKTESILDKIDITIASLADNYSWISNTEFPQPDASELPGLNHPDLEPSDPADSKLELDGSELLELNYSELKLDDSEFNGLIEIYYNRDSPHLTEQALKKLGGNLEPSGRTNDTVSPNFSERSTSTVTTSNHENFLNFFADTEEEELPPSPTVKSKLKRRSSSHCQLFNLEQVKKKTRLDDKSARELEKNNSLIFGAKPGQKTQ